MKNRHFYRCMTNWLIPALVAVVGLVWSSMTLAQRVKELAPNELAAFLAQHPKVVVQMTSPSKKCTFCVGADRAFDQATVQTPQHWAFARVQWEPWHKFPTFEGVDVKLHGVPVQVMFVQGRNGGMFERPLLTPTAFAALLGEVDQGQLRPDGYWSAEHLPGYQAPVPTAHTPKTLPAKATKLPAASPAAASGEAKDAGDGSSIMWREMVQTELMRSCTRRYPQDRALHENGLQRWRNKHTQALERAARDMFDGASPGKPSTVESEIQATQAWLLQSHGVASGDRDPQPSRQQCATIAATLSER